MILLRKYMYIAIFLLILYVVNAQEVEDELPLTKQPGFWLIIVGLNIAVIVIVSFLIVKLASREETPSLPFRNNLDKYFKFTNHEQKREYLNFSGKTSMFILTFYTLLVWRYPQSHILWTILLVIAYIILNYVYFKHYKKPNY